MKNEEGSENYEECGGPDFYVSLWNAPQKLCAEYYPCSCDDGEGKHNSYEDEDGGPAQRLE